MHNCLPDDKFSNSLIRDYHFAQPLFYLFNFDHKTPKTIKTLIPKSFISFICFILIFSPGWKFFVTTQQLVDNSLIRDLKLIHNS